MLVLAAFFISARGRDDPAAELRATLAALATGAAVGAEHQPAPCAFPARARYLKGRGAPVARVECPGFESFRSGLGAERVTLVFASAYANNPASAFGHVALRLTPLSGPKRQPLLGETVAFVARIDPSDDALSYTVKGLIGGR